MNFTPRPTGSELSKLRLQFAHAGFNSLSQQDLYIADKHSGGQLAKAGLSEIQARQTRLVTREQFRKK